MTHNSPVWKQSLIFSRAAHGELRRLPTDNGVSLDALENDLLLCQACYHWIIQLMKVLIELAVEQNEWEVYGHESCHMWQVDNQ